MSILAHHSDVSVALLRREVPDINEELLSLLELEGRVDSEITRRLWAHYQASGTAVGVGSEAAKKSTKAHSLLVAALQLRRQAARYQQFAASPADYIEEIGRQELENMSLWRGFVKEAAESSLPGNSHLWTRVHSDPVLYGAVAAAVG